jgi:hypothetical protein
MTNGGCSNFVTFYRNPFILLPSSCPKRIIVVLGHTTDQRHERTATDVKLSYAQLGITVVQLKSHKIPTHDNYEVICQSKFWNKREVTLAIDTKPQQGQQYAVVLSTYYPDINTSFWIQLFSKELLPFVEIRTWLNIFQQNVQTIHGEWHQGNAGGRRKKTNPLTFYQNPAYVLTVSDTSSVRLILHQSFQTFVPLTQHHPIGIYILSTTANEEPIFARARSVSRLVRLNAGEEYYVVPTCFEANLFGKFELDVLSDVVFTLDPVERKLPTPPPVEDKTPTPTSTENKASASTATTRKIVSTTRKSVSPTRKPVTTTATRTTGTKQVPKRGNLSLATARLSTLADDYSKIT